MAEETVNAQTEPNNDVQPAEPATETVTLTAAELQSQLDSESDKRLAKAQAKWEADNQQRLEDAKSEGAKLAKMTAAEKAAAEDEARTKSLDKREAALNQKELSTSTVSLLIDNQLPKDLAEPLVKLGDAEAIKAAVASFKDVIDGEVNKRVNESLQTTPPVNGASALNGSDDPFDAKIKKYE